MDGSAEGTDGHTGRDSVPAHARGTSLRVRGGRGDVSRKASSRKTVRRCYGRYVSFFEKLGEVKWKRRKMVD